MAKKSLIQRSAVDTVLKSHNCQANSRHRLQRGELRLKVWKDRSTDHYCAACALAIIERDILVLNNLAAQLKAMPSFTESNLTEEQENSSSIPY